MKKTAFMIVYNDADYVDYAIRSVKDWVDELVIVEGAFEITMKTGKPARSNDGTLDIIHSHVDNEKVFLKQVNLHEHKDHYQVGYQFAVDNGSDWAIMVDSDEVWTNRSKLLADIAMRQKNAPWELRVNEFCFINDFEHWYPGTYPRIFKANPAGVFVYDNEVMWNGHRGKHSIGMVPERNIFHYGYVRRKKRWEMKQQYMWEKDQNPNLKNYKLDGNTYIIPSDIPVYQFAGGHPEMMWDHPFHGKTAQDIIHG